MKVIKRNVLAILCKCHISTALKIRTLLRINYCSIIIFSMQVDQYGGLQHEGARLCYEINDPHGLVICFLPSMRPTK